MSLQFHPAPGTILFCNYAGFRKPEMIKRRPVIIVSPRSRRAASGCVLVVPLSTTSPNPIQPYHCEVTLAPPLPDRMVSRCWAKCDMINAVGFWRLELIKIGKDASGKRLYRTLVLDAEQVSRVRECVRRALNL
jgi:mRNA interferase MazF